MSAPIDQILAAIANVQGRLAEFQEAFEKQERQRAKVTAETAVLTKLEEATKAAQRQARVAATSLRELLPEVVDPTETTAGAMRAMIDEMEALTKGPSSFTADGLLGAQEKLKAAYRPPGKKQPARRAKRK